MNNEFDDKSEMIQGELQIKESQEQGNNPREKKNISNGNEENKSDRNKENKSNRSNKIKNSFRSKKFKGGAYATSLSVVMIVLIVIINLFVSELNIKIDLTADAKNSLTNETVDMIKNLEDKITIYYLAESGTEIEQFKNILENYEKVNDNIKLEYKDPVKYPKFASQYVDDEISAQSLLIVNETNKRAKYLTYNDIVVSEMDYTTYQSTVTGIDVEGRVDAAIQYVTNKDLPKVYAVSGHGETSMTSTMTSLLSKANIETDSLNTLTSEVIPEDCDVLFINQPQSDYSAEEVELIKNYFSNGGDAIISVDYTTSELPIFTSLINSYGINVVKGIVLEGDSNFHRGNYMNELVPDIGVHTFTEGIRNKKFIVAPVATGLTIIENISETITTNPFLTTSDKAYSKTDYNSSTSAKEANDVDGPFYLGLEVTEGTDENKMRLVFYSGKYIFDDSYLSTNVFGNQDLLINTVNDLAEQENTVSIRTTSLSEESLVMTSAQKNRNGAVVTFLIPLAFIIVGIGVTVQRRRK